MQRFAVPFWLLTLCSLAPGQSVVDSNLVVQTWVSGLDNPTGAAFLNSRGDMLVIEKNSGKVRVVRDRKLRGTLLDLPVANDSERGLLGIALSPTFATDNFVYLYHTPSTVDGGDPINNKISRYRYDGSSLVFDRRIIDLPVQTGPNHNGGRMVFGKDGKLYTVIGDLNLNNATSNYGGQPTANTAAVLRLNPSGSAAAGNPFPDAPRIFAYGVRNSFGLAVDPVTGDLWDTENGAQSFDEINRVFKGFNSGWEKIMGPVSRNGGTLPELNPLGDAAVYDDPKFSWSTPVAPTDLEFFPTTRLGAQYKNDLFVGTTRGGKILRYDLTSTRKSLALTGDLADLVANNSTDNRFAEQDSILFGSDFGLVTDLLPGPGGLYVTDFANGKIFRITTVPVTKARTGTPIPEPSATAIAAASLLLMLRRRKL